MDQIALIADIHGNVLALEAVLKDIRSRGIHNIYCLGDLVGKGPFSEQAVDLVREHCQVVVQGNWDEFIENAERDDLMWHYERLGPDRIAYLKALPYSHDFYVSGRLVRVFHASPQDLNHRVHEDAPLARRTAMFESTELLTQPEGTPDIVAYADIHGAYLQHIRERTLLNTGSVGNPLDQPDASYVIVTGYLGSRERGPFSVSFARVPFDVELAISQAREAGMPALEPFIYEMRTADYRGNMHNNPDWQAIVSR